MSTCRALTYSHLLCRYGISAPFKVLVELIVPDDFIIGMCPRYIEMSRNPAGRHSKNPFSSASATLGYLIILSRLPVNFPRNL